MRRFFIILLTALVIVPNGWADDIDNALGDTVSAEAKALTRAAVGPQVTQEGAIRMTQVMAAHKFSNVNMVRALQTVIDTQNRALPVGPVMDKAFEGIAKKASDAAIVAAMDRTQSRYAVSRQKAVALSSRRDVVDTLTSLAADALAAGMTVQDMDRISAQLQQQAQARTRAISEDEDTRIKVQTMMTVRTMARFGVPSQVVADVTCQAVARQFSYQEINAVRSQFVQQARSQNAAAVAGRFGEAIGRGARGSDIGRGIDGGGAGGGGGSGGGGSGGGGTGGGGTGGGGTGGGGTGGGGSGGGGSGGGGSGGGGSGGGGSGGGSGGGGSGGGSGGGGSGGGGGK